MVNDNMFRWIVLTVMVVTFVMSARFRSKAREDETIERKQESKLTIALRLLFALPLYLSILIYIINPRWMTWAALPLAGWVRWLGAGFSLGSIPLLWWMFGTIGKNISETVLTKESHQLVTSGPYRWVRHPLYSFALLNLAGISLMSANAFISVMTLLGGFMIIAYVIPQEELELVAKFGEAYASYQRRVGKVLPGLGKENDKGQ